ncbi:MAG: hypothetical protein J3R72DRAFT_402512 [Linnemannia gamsii]|nr:MAG: hypothetical protein J3R72DRAFT_402512 [Linnemannia gamsii]
MTTASASLSTSSVNTMGSPIPQHGQMVYNNHHNNSSSGGSRNNSHNSYQSGSAPSSPTFSNQQYSGQQYSSQHNNHSHHHLNSQYSQHHRNNNNSSSSLSSSYTTIPQGDEPRRTSVPAGLSSSYPRDHSVEPRMMSGGQTQRHSSGSDSHYPPPTPGSYHVPPRPQQRYSNQPGTRSSWAGNPSSTAEFESNFTLTSSNNKSSSSPSSSATTPTSATPYFRRSVHLHDTQDDYHHSPQHGTYIPPSSSSIGHQEYQANNNSSNSLDEAHNSYNGTKSSSQQQPYFHHKREGSYSSVDYHYQNSSSQDGYSADPYTIGGGPGGYDSGLAAAAATGNSNNDNGTGKHRNNSVSSNASQSSTSSLSHYHPHLSGNKHPCKFPSCGWSFKRYEHLKRHMLVHSKERAFVCDYHGCEKSFSRSDNFSAHLRTHTKKSAAAAAGTTTAHMRRFERQQQQQMATTAAAAGGGHGGGVSMMVDPIRTNFPNSSMSALVSSGPLSDAPPERRSGASEGGSGGADYSHHRHSIAGYPSYSSGGGSRSPLQMQNIYSHGLPTPGTNQGPNSATTRSARNSFCGPSSSSPDDPTSSSSPTNYDQQQHQNQQQQQQQYHQRSPSSAMHPLDSPVTPTSATTPTNATFAAGPAAASIGKTGTVDGMGSIVPKFNTIKLDLKSITNHLPEDSQQQQQCRPQQYYNQQQQRRFSSPRTRDGVDEEDVEIKSSRSTRQRSPSLFPYHHYQQQQHQRQQREQQHRYSSGSLHSGFKSEEDGDEQKHLIRRRSGSDDEDRHYEQSSLASVSTVTGYERPNPNPNGESPVMAPRGTLDARPGSEDEMEEEGSSRGAKFESLSSSSMAFPASISSHFTPASGSGNNINNIKGVGSSRQGSPVTRAAATDVQDGVKKTSASSGQVDRRPLSSVAAVTHGAGGSNGVEAGRGAGGGGHEYASMSGSYQHLNGSVSPPRSNSDSYSGSVPMDEDGNPLHPQHRFSGYHYSQQPHLGQHHGGYAEYDRDRERVGGYPPSPHMHHHASTSTSSSTFYQAGQQNYNGPSSSSSINNYPNHHHHHSQYPPSYNPQQQQYSMEDSGSYSHHNHSHHSHHDPHGMPPMPTTTTISSRQQHQSSQQVSRSTGSGSVTGGGGRVRGMTSSAKNHCCPVSGCMKRFKRLEHLKRHTKTHTLERPFACSTAGCNKRFSRSDNLSQHIKTHQRQLMSKIHWKQRSM